jgi:uncharacterized protein YvpB
MIALSIFFFSGLLVLVLLFIHGKTTQENSRKRLFQFALICFFTSIGFFAYYVSDHWHILHTKAATLFSETEPVFEPMHISPQKVHINVKQAKPVTSVKLEAPLFNQMPELPRGCELTSLSMLLAYHEIDADKMELAQHVTRNPATFERRDGKVYFGNPNNGFVGDMLSLTTPGLGVYHKPIAQLAGQFAPDLTVKDFTGDDFSSVIEQLQKGRPVWVIINAWYKELPESEFITWHTEDGPIEITYREHSVLITGYDEEFIYFNDPLNYETKAPRQHFKAAWEQMGKQAITIY